MLITDEKKLDTTLERFYNRYNKYNTDVLKTLGNVVKQFDGLTPSQAHQLAQELKIGYDVYKLQEELAKISGKSVEEVDKLLEKVAEENVEFSEVYYKAKNKEYVDYENNSQLQNLIESIKKETNNTFVNISKSQNTGFSLKQDDGSYIYKTIPQVYNDLIDEAVYNVSIGMVDYQSAMRNTLNQLADSGVKVHEEKMTYKSGYNRRIDSSVRQNILTGLRQVNIGVQEEVGKDFGADGIEISAHVPCAEDHIDIQGRQYKKEKFEKLNSDLMGPIGTLNCTHFVFSVVLGVEEPNYTKEQLEQMKRESREKVSYKGKTYTKYEATQVQRRLETAIRQQKDRQITARASGDKEGILKAQNKITQLTKEYNEFSKSAGLRTYKNRLTVSGYRRVSVSNNINTNIKYKDYFDGYYKNENERLDRVLEVDEIFTEKYKTIYDNMNGATKEAFIKYSGHYYKDINKYLLGKNIDDSDNWVGVNGVHNINEYKQKIDSWTKLMDDEINKHPINENLILWKGTKSKYYNNLDKEKPFSIDIYNSTSLNRNIAETFTWNKDDAVVLKIKIPKETKGLYINGDIGTGEMEMLLSRKQKYKYIKTYEEIGTSDYLKNKNKKIKIIELEAIR